MKVLLIFFLLFSSSLVLAENCDEPEPWGGAHCTQNSQCNINAYSQNSNDNY